MVANAEWDQVRHTLRTFSRVIILVTIPVMAILLLFSRPIVELLFLRGAFTDSDVTEVAFVQTMYALQVPFFALGILFVRLLSSLGANQILLYQASVSLGIVVLLDYTLSRAIGVAGIALATSLMYAIGFFFLAFMGLRKLKVAERENVRSPTSLIHSTVVGND
jgi:putative peptidoglycan lipid II flippase